MEKALPSTHVGLCVCKGGVCRLARSISDTTHTKHLIVPLVPESYHMHLQGCRRTNQSTHTDLPTGSLAARPLCLRPAPAGATHSTNQPTNPATKHGRPTLLNWAARELQERCTDMLSAVPLTTRCQRYHNTTHNHATNRDAT